MIHSVLVRGPDSGIPSSTKYRQLYTILFQKERGSDFVTVLILHMRFHRICHFLCCLLVPLNKEAKGNSRRKMAYFAIYFVRYRVSPISDVFQAAYSPNQLEAANKLK
jgi:hypothetical protein